MKIYFIALLLITGATTYAQTGKPDSFFVKMKDGSTIYPHKLEVVSPKKADAYLLADSTQQIPLTKVARYKKQDGLFSIGELNNTPAIYKVETPGKRIDLLSKTFEYYDRGYSPAGYWTSAGYHPGPTMGARTVKIKASFYQKGNNEITPLQYKYLKNDLSDNDESMKALKVYKTKNNIKTGLGWAAFGVTIAGILQTLQKEKSEGSYISPLIYAGGAMIITYSFVLRHRSKHLDEAVVAYNQ